MCSVLESFVCGVQLASRAHCSNKDSSSALPPLGHFVDDRMMQNRRSICLILVHSEIEASDACTMIVTMQIGVYIIGPGIIQTLEGQI